MKSDQKYHLVVTKNNGTERAVTREPMTHGECCTMKSKFSEYDQARIRLVPFNDQPEPPCTHSSGVYQLEGETYCRECSRIIPDKQPSLSEGFQIETLAQEFLRWPLPKSVCADLCATRQCEGRTGTNLLSYVEAKQMFSDLLKRAALVGEMPSESDRLRESHAALIEHLSNAVRCAERDAHGTAAPKWTIKARETLAKASP